MPKILALDTSSECCSVSLYEGTQPLGSASAQTPRSHTQLALPMLSDLLAEHKVTLAEVDAIAFGKGPGSFTGIRIASALAQGLAFGADKPIYGISSLEAMALQAYLDSPCQYILVAFDARMNEVYWSLYELGESTENSEKTFCIRSLSGECVTKPEEIDLAPYFNTSDESAPSIKGIGSGFAFFDRFSAITRDLISGFDEQAQPRADAVAMLAYQAMKQNTRGDLSDALPSYVRNTVTWKKLPGRE